MSKHWVYHIWKDESDIVETERYENMLESGEWVDSRSKVMTHEEYLKKKIKKSKKKIKELEDVSSNTDEQRSDSKSTASN